MATVTLSRLPKVPHTPTRYATRDGRFVIEPREGKWYVSDTLSRALSGPYRSMDQAREWLDRLLTPTDAPTAPDRFVTVSAEYPEHVVRYLGKRTVLYDRALQQWFEVPPGEVQVRIAALKLLPL